MTAVLFDYGRSSAAYRLRITLNHMNIPYDQVPVNLRTGAHKQPENLARNPQGLVPTLDIDGHTLTRSLAIIEYLNETRNGNLLPDGALPRARVRAISHAIAMEIHPVCNLSVARFASDNSGGGIAMKDWMTQFIPKGLAAVENMLNHPDTGIFCHGDILSMANICLVPQMYNADRWAIDVSPFPTINRIVANARQLAPIRKAHPDQNMVTGN